MGNPNEFLRLAARVALARQDFLEFCTLVDCGYQTPRHLQLVARYLEELERGEIHRLLILMPPRSGKSYTCTQLFPAWYLGRDPARRIILTAHTAALAESFSLAIRDIVDTGRYYSDVFPGVRVSESQRAAFRWALHGYRDTVIAAGIGGGITGYGANCLTDDVFVHTRKGAISIAQVKVGDDVMARGGGSLCFSRVVAVRQRVYTGMLVTITDERGHYIRGTPEHLVYLPDEGAYAPLGELDVGMRVLRVGENGMKPSTIVRVHREDVQEKPVYDLQTRGNYFASGILVHNCLIIDDPVKNFEEAISDTVQQRNWDWYTTTARTRLMGKGQVLVVMTHWTEGDLAGRILDSAEGKEFVVLALPAESLGTHEDATPEYLESLDAFSRKYVFPDALGRPRGAPLWPEMGFDKAFLENARAVLGYQYQGLYQCSPTVPQGVVFEKSNFKAITEAQLQENGYRRSLVVRSFDLAFSESQRADFTVGLRVALWARAEGKPRLAIVLEDCAAWRSEWDESSEKIIELASRDGREVALLVEAVASQNLAFKSLRRDPRLANHTIVPVTPDKDKVARAQYALRLTSIGVVYILYPNSTSPPAWEEAFLSEVASFPYGIHDDRVDALTQALNYLQPSIDALLVHHHAGDLGIRPSRQQRPWMFQEGSAEGGPTRDELVWRET
jgi:predicted phage terminase large subunit-like protein